MVIPCTCSTATVVLFAATQECRAADTGHDTPPRHSIQTQGQPVVVLSIDKLYFGLSNVIIS